MDFASLTEVSSIFDTIISLINRGIPLRWGLVPQTLTPAAVEQAKVVYYLQDTYGLSGVTAYLQAVSLLSTIYEPD